MAGYNEILSRDRELNGGPSTRHNIRGADSGEQGRRGVEECQENIRNGVGGGAKPSE